MRSMSDYRHVLGSIGVKLACSPMYPLPAELVRDHCIQKGSNAATLVCHRSEECSFIDCKFTHSTTAACKPERQALRERLKKPLVVYTTLLLDTPCNLALVLEPLFSMFHIRGYMSSRLVTEYRRLQCCVMIIRIVVQVVADDIVHGNVKIRSQWAQNLTTTLPRLKQNARGRANSRLLQHRTF